MSAFEYTNVTHGDPRYMTVNSLGQRVSSFLTFGAAKTDAIARKLTVMEWAPLSEGNWEAHDEFGYLDEA